MVERRRSLRRGIAYKYGMRWEEVRNSDPFRAFWANSLRNRVDQDGGVSTWAEMGAEYEWSSQRLLSS